MREITVFPEEFKLVNEQVAEVSVKGFLSRDEYDAETLAEIAKWDDYPEEDFRAREFSMRLKDGRAYGFLAATPEYLRDYMEKENEVSFVSLGLLVVREVTEATILHALEACLSEAAYFGVEPLGYRMTTPEKFEVYIEDDPPPE